MVTEGVMVVIMVTLGVVKLSKASLGHVFCSLVLSNVVVVAWVANFRAVLLREVPRPPTGFIIVVIVSLNSDPAC